MPVDHNGGHVMPTNRKDEVQDLTPDQLDAASGGFIWFENNAFIWFEHSGPASQLAARGFNPQPDPPAKAVAL